MVRRTTRFFILAITASLWLQGCASVSVKEVSKEKSGKVDLKPQKIYVRDFAVDLSEFNVDREGWELENFKQLTSTMMTEALIERIGKHLIEAVPLREGDPLPIGNVWLLEGRFDKVNQGSRALRMFIGFGAGGSKLNTSIEVYDLSNPGLTPILTFSTTGGSGASPGAITSGPGIQGAISAGITLASLSSSGITEDVERTSRMITAYLSEFMHQKGWISDEQKLTAKKLIEPSL